MLQELVLAILIIILLLLFLRFAHDTILDDRVHVQAFDGVNYKVRNIANKKESAETLARINKKVVALIDNLVKEDGKDDIPYRPMILRLKKRYNPQKLSEGRIDKRFTSYTVNKGEQMVLCLRSRDEKDEIYDDNLLFYVVIHELAHVASVGENHNEEFHTNFRYLLKKASEWNMFQKVDDQFHYCGLDVHGM